MHYSARHPLVLRLLGSAGVFAIIYFTLGLERPIWKSRHMFPPVDLISSPSAPSTLPKKLWYKLGPNGLSDELRGYVDGCLSMNPTFESGFVTDLSGDAFVAEHFATRPDIVEAFLTIRIPIIRADLLRYLILYTHGGIWNDLDVSCEAPISEWIPAQHQANASIVVGLEFDVDIWVRQFASWTIMAKPKSPHMLTVVEDCLEALHEKSREHNVGMQDLKLNMLGDIVDFSGPRRLTRGILKSLSAVLNTTIGDDEIAHVSEPRLIGDVLVLPDYSFANSMNEQHGDKIPGQVLVRHHYAGSWKNDFGGELPIESNS
ncbi:Initiation-specific alpha-1,6-mannosyltransferase [Lachnellula occidentalis]|uniref:Initiation-specific alpha-1,6-mannosyltransferase n=1 Tax=Lachnellula occidentalis TaxID=215460 RepID=A0A8H8UH43_9HELO|nr:Initiation-specific alpha-1,6-mannosyltransferase [Lachnellula occidentalis]